VLSAIFVIAGTAAGSAQDKAQHKTQDKPFVATSPTPEGEAWWLRTEYHPFGTDVRGIPAARLHAGWCKVNELRKEQFPPDLALSFEGEKSPFAVDGLFDGSKTGNTALVGVYETCKGARGAFLLIVAWPKGKPPVIRHLVDLKGERQFAVVSVSEDSTITLQHCLECDNISQYKWVKSKRRFVLLPLKHEQ
jgi:hypothetical protein